MSKIQTIYERQVECGYIKSINIFRNISGEECSQYNIELSLVSFPYWDEDECFDIVFEGVSNLKIGDIDNLFRVSIQIQPIIEYQRENVRYEVKESENELFSFCCANFKICN